MRLNLQTKLLALFGLCAAIVFVVGGINFVSTRELTSKFSVLTDSIVPAQTHIAEMKASILEIETILLKMFHLPKERKQLYDSLRSKLELYKESKSEYAKINFPAEEMEYRKKLEAHFDDFYADADKAAAAAVLNKPESNAEFEYYLEHHMREDHAKVMQSLADLMAYQKKYAEKAESLASQSGIFAQNLSMLACLLGFISAFAIGFLFARNLSKKLNHINAEIAASALQTAEGGRELSSASNQLSSGSTEAAASLEETVASLEELSSMVKRNADHAREASALSQQNKLGAETGETEIRQLISAMSEIASGSKKIEQIINVIDDIAFQTNLLALNAAVEAARAGEQGKGFAVVADAVRGLAQRSATAAKDISGLIKESVVKTQRGTEIAGRSGQVLESIVSSAKKVADLNNEIAVASQEQAEGIAQINTAMNQLDQATQLNASSAEEIAASSEQMSQQAQSLQNIVGELSLILSGRSEVALSSSESSEKSLNEKSDNSATPEKSWETQTRSSAPLKSSPSASATPQKSSFNLEKNSMSPLGPLNSPAMTTKKPSSITPVKSSSNPKKPASSPVNAKKPSSSAPTSSVISAKPSATPVIPLPAAKKTGTSAAEIIPFDEDLPNEGASRKVGTTDGF